MNRIALSEVDSTKYHTDIATYVLNHCDSKIPITIAEIASSLGINTKTLKKIFPDAIKKLRDVFGIRMKAIPDNDNKFICYVKYMPSSAQEFNDEQKKKLTLLFIILSYIFLSEKSVDEEALVDFLAGLKIDVDEEHRYFGDNLRLLITSTFVKQLYLKKTKSTSELENVTRFIYTWGYRSTLEFTKRRVLELSAQIMNICPEVITTKFDEIRAEAAEEESEDERVEKPVAMVIDDDANSSS